MPFRDVIGHRRLIALLAGSIERDALPPSLVFAGPEGVGKRLVGIAVAQALNCTRLQQTPSFDACGRCATCTRIARLIHPDVLLLEPGDSGTIKIEQVRDVTDRIGYKPFEGRRRVVLIDDADALVVPAQQALLKTLEEPPSSAALILVTARPDVLLPTVRSRCPRLHFRPLGEADIARALIGRGCDELAARTAATASRGSLGEAIGTVAGELVAARDLAVRVLFSAAVSDDPRRRLESAKELSGGKSAAATRDELATRLRAMASVLRDVAASGAASGPSVMVNLDLLPTLARLEPFRGERAVRAFAAVKEGLQALQRNGGVKVVADWVMLQL